MKNVLPLLLCYVLMTAQTYAISGGPVFTQNNASVSGTYSGILQQVTADGTLATASTLTGTNSIGLFSLGIPRASIATGNFLLFANGLYFTGTIVGVVDPGSSQLVGVIQASFSRTSTYTDGTTTVVQTNTTNTTASGNINAKLSAARTSSAGSARLKGSAAIDLSFRNTGNIAAPVDQTLLYNVTGFQQSSTVSVASFGTATTSTGGGSTN